MYSLSNSIGDLSYPEVGFWTDVYNKNMLAAHSMIVMIKAIYFAHAIFVVVMLSNMLVSVISEIYDKTQDEKEVNRL
jgi:hypothetical protein